MSTSTYYIPLEWQHRIRTLPSLTERAVLAVYLISRYKQLKHKHDRSLGNMAFWPTHAREQIYNFHVLFLRTDKQYNDMVVADSAKSKRKYNLHHAKEQYANSTQKSLL